MNKYNKLVHTKMYINICVYDKRIRKEFLFEDLKLRISLFVMQLFGDLYFCVVKTNNYWDKYKI